MTCVVVGVACGVLGYYVGRLRQAAMFLPVAREIRKTEDMLNRFRQRTNDAEASAQRIAVLRGNDPETAIIDLDG